MLIDFEAVKGVWLSPKVDVIEALLAYGNRSHVQHVMVNGKWVIRDGRSTALDESEIISAIRRQLDSQINNPHQQRLSKTVAALTPYLRQYYTTWED